MKNKKLVKIGIVAGLIAAIGGGATLAYLTDTTPEVKNTFTVGDVKIELDEPDWNPDEAQDMEPGSIVDKNPQITNTGKNPAYLLMSVEGMDEMYEKNFRAIFDATKWVLVDENGKPIPDVKEVEYKTTDGKDIKEKGPGLVDGYYVYTGNECNENNLDGVVNAGKTTKPLFKEVKYLEEGIGTEFASYEVVGRFLVMDGEKEIYCTGEELTKLNNDRREAAAEDVKRAEGDLKEQENARKAYKNLEPETDENGKRTVKYFIKKKGATDYEKNILVNKDSEETKDFFDSYDEAEDVILNILEDKDISYQFDIILKSYAIQSQNIEFETGGVYTWVKDAAEALENLDGHKKETGSTSTPGEGE